LRIFHWVIFSGSKSLKFLYGFRYNLVSQEQGELQVDLTLVSANQWNGLTQTQFVVNKGNGSHTYNLSVTPQNWSPYGVRVTLSPYPHGSSWNALALDIKTLSVK